MDNHIEETSKKTKHSNIHVLASTPEIEKFPRYQLKQAIKNAFIKAKTTRKNKLKGHYGVTRSILKGFENININYNYNQPKNITPDCIIIVLSGKKTLRHAIQLKKQNRIKTLIAGPNIVVYPQDKKRIILSDQIDAILVPSNITKDFWITLQADPKKIYSWAAGVDTDYWRPKHECRKTKHCLIYNKWPLNETLDKTKITLTNNGWTYEEIEYGKYTHLEYLDALGRSSVVIGFSPSESQGLAWAEAWATDTPTIIFENETYVYRNTTVPCSTAPYLSNKTGAFFQTQEQLLLHLQRIIESNNEFSPRQWTKQHMCDSTAAQELLKIISIIVNIKSQNNLNR